MARRSLDRGQRGGYVASGVGALELMTIRLVRYVISPGIPRGNMLRDLFQGTSLTALRADPLALHKTGRVRRSTYF